MNNNIEDFEELEELEANAEGYSCPSCGAPIKFDPKTSTLECSYCGFRHEFNGKETDVEFDLDEDARSEDKSWNNETKTVKCEGCGSLNVVDLDGMTSTCPFCGSHKVIDTEELSGIKPHRVIPFKLTDEEAKNLYINFVKKKFFTPRKVKKSKIDVLVCGVYLPMWTFDTKTFSSYTGRLGKHYTKVVGSGKNRRTVTKTRWYRISGNINVNFDDLLVNAGKQITQKEIESIAPFSTNESFEYDKKFLAGFSAEHYQVPLRKGWDIARALSNPIIERNILKRYIYDVKGEVIIHPNYYDNKFKYVLVPVWIGNYTYKGKKYRFIVNGETGKLSGKAPVSALKVTLTVLLVILIIGIIIFLVYNSGNL